MRVSGRARPAVTGALVDLDHLHFAGSHGFDISGPDGLREQRGDEFRSALDAAADLLDDAVAVEPEAWVQRKRYALAVHYRNSPPGAEARLEPIVEEVVGGFSELRMAGGKAIFEVRPDIEWDKGTAVLLREVPSPPPTGVFLDLGCGWGPLALTLALRSPAARSCRPRSRSP